MTQQESQSRINPPVFLRRPDAPTSLIDSDRIEEVHALAEAARLAGIGSYTLDLNSGECKCNASLCAILEIGSSENVHECFQNGIEQSCKKQMAESLERIAACGGNDVFTHGYCLADGRMLKLRTSRSAIADGVLPATKLICCIEDISVQSLANAKLRESELRCRTLMDFATDSFILHSFGGVIVDVNQSACENYGYTKAEFVGQYPSFFAVALEPERLAAIIRDLDEGRTVSYDSVHRRKDGTTFPAEVRIRPIVLDGKRFVVTLSRDITDRKNAELDLRESERHLRLALDTAQIGSWRYQLYSDEVHLDARCQQHMGVQQSHLTTDEVCKRIYPSDLVRIQSVFQTAIANNQNGEHVKIDFRILFPDGSIRWISAKAILDFDIASSRGILIGTTLDITDQRNAVAALEGQSRVFEQIATGQSLTTILEEITQFVEQLIPESVCYILLTENDGDYLNHVAGARVPESLKKLSVRIAENEGSCGTAAWSGKQVIVVNTATDIRAEKYIDLYKDCAIHSCWSTPIFEVSQSDDPLRSNTSLKRPVVGTLAVCRSYQGDPDGDAQSNMETAVRLAEIAISHVRGVQELRESEMRYTVMSEISRIVTFGISRSSEGAEWRIDWSRPQIGLLTGYNADEIVGASWERIVHPDDHLKCHQILLEIVSTKTAKIEARIRAKSGQTLETQIHLKLESLDAETGAAALIGGLLDISEFKAVESALRTSEERFELAVSGTNDGLWDWDLRTNATYFSPRWKTMLGYEPHELSNEYSTWLSLLHPEDAEDVQSHLKEFFSSQSSLYDQEFRMRSRQGDYRLVQCKGALSRDSHGSPIRMVGTQRDLTERRSAELALRRSEEFLRRAQMMAHVGNWTLDLETQIFTLSDEASRIFELDSRTCTLDAWLKLVYPEDLQRIRHAYSTALSGGTFDLEYRLVSDGKIKWLSSKATLEFDSTYNTPVFVGVTQDISARTRLEEQLRQSQKMEAFGQLAGGVAHDFNNLLTVINGFSELLLAEMPKGQLLRDYVEQIQQAGERAAGLTRQLLTLGRRQFTEPRIIDLNEITARSEAMLKRLIGENIQVKTEYYSKLPNIKADAGQIDQVLLNLAVNARDAMPNGGRLSIKTGVCSLEQSEAPCGLGDLASGEYVELIVADTGTGMTDEVKARIFEPFFSTKGVGKGTGLGLSTVYGIVKQNHGAIAVASTPGGGSSFRILFPIELNQAPSVENVSSHKIIRGSETILLAEDEDLVRQIVVTSLTAQGYKVLAANSGEAALDLASRYDEPLHLLITDMVMPGISGSQLAERLKVQFSHLKVLYMSGYTDDMEVRLGVFAEGCEFIQKPFTPMQLNQVVHNLLQVS